MYTRERKEYEMSYNVNYQTMPVARLERVLNNTPEEPVPTCETKQNATRLTNLLHE